MGVCGVLSPSKIWKFKLKSPAKLINRDTVIFVTEKIISILKSSKISQVLLKTSSYSLFSTGNINDSEGEGNTEESDRDNEINIEQNKFELTEGTLPDPKLYPVLARFNIPVDNEHTLSALLAKILSLACHKNVD